MSEKCFIAVDLGGTQIRAARYTAAGVQEERVAIATLAHEGQEAVLARVYAAVREAWPRDGAIAAIGIGAPGPVDYKQGILRFAPNLPGWVNVPLKTLLEAQFNVPVFVGNDADIAALGEHRFGAGQGVSDMIYMTISTGVGGGMIFGNRLFTGGNGMGGEVGHMSVDPTGPKCACGNTGCLETVASGTAIARRARARVAGGEPSLLIDMVHGEILKITAKEVNEAAQLGDAVACAVFEEAATYLGAAIVSLMYMLNPSLFVLGGSVTQAGELLFGPINAVVAARAPAVYRAQTRIVPAQLGGDVGLWGALALCLMENE